METKTCSHFIHLYLLLKAVFYILTDEFLLKLLHNIKFNIFGMVFFIVACYSNQTTYEIQRLRLSGLWLGVVPHAMDPLFYKHTTAGPDQCCYEKMLNQPCRESKPGSLP